jgi:hypothetical protein
MEDGMEVIEGRVQKLRLGTEVSGDTESVSTKHVATLQLQNRPIRIEASVPLMVEDGDSFAVAGFQGPDGVLTAYAYKNLQNGVKSLVPGSLSYLFLVPFLAIGGGASLVVFYSLFLSGAGVGEVIGTVAFAGLFAAGFGFVGINGCRELSRARRASAALC